jgi:hypothetical protein
MLWNVKFVMVSQFDPCLSSYIYKECTLLLQPKPLLFADDSIIMYHPKSAHFKNCIDSTVAEWAGDAE